MRILIVGVLLLCCFQTGIAQSTQKKIAQARYNYVSNNWQGLDSNLFDYNNKGLEVLNTALIFDTFNWKNNLRYISYYDSLGNLSLNIRQRFQNGAWQNLRRFTYTYDIKSRPTFASDSTWDNVTGTWRYNAKVETTYLNGQVLQETRYARDASFNPVYFLKTVNEVHPQKPYITKSQNYEWDNVLGWWLQKKELFSYNSYDSLDFYSLFEAAIVGDTLEPIYRRFYFYDANKNLDLTFLENYYENDSQQVYYLYMQDDYTFNANKQVTKIQNSVYDTANQAWILNNTKQYTYNSAGGLQEFRYTDPYFINTNYRYTLAYNSDTTLADSVYYSGVDTVWTERYKTQYQYDGNKNRTYKLVQEKQSSSYVNLRQEFYYYNQWPLALSNEQRISLKPFPNPCTKKLFFTLPEGVQTQLLDIRVLDQMGRVRMQMQQHSPNQGAIELDTDPLPQGNYILNCTVGKSVYCANFIKM